MAKNKDKGNKEKNPLSDVKPKEIPTDKHTYQKHDSDMKLTRNNRRLSSSMHDSNQKPSGSKRTK